jgi:cytochrome c oxidase subunit 2
MQQLAWIIALTLMAAIAGLFAWVAAGASVRADAPGPPFRWRAALFWLSIAAGLVITFMSLSPWPIPAHAAGAAAPDVVIVATGRQWSWELSRDTVAAGQTVEFHVTSADVNHGFAIYRRETEMMAQTQAMPGYVNRLRVRFDAPGEYAVLCLEYCGLAHHAMSTRILVR